MVPAVPKSLQSTCSGLGAVVHGSEPPPGLHRPLEEWSNRTGPSALRGSKEQEGEQGQAGDHRVRGSELGLVGAVGFLWPCHLFTNNSRGTLVSSGIFRNGRLGWEGWRLESRLGRLGGDPEAPAQTA